MAYQINEFGEIIRDGKYNELPKKEQRLKLGTKIVIFLTNLITFFIVGLICYFRYSSKGYDKKSKQVCALSIVGFFSFFVLVVILQILLEEVLYYH